MFEQSRAERVRELNQYVALQHLPLAKAAPITWKSALRIPQHQGLVLSVTKSAQNLIPNCSYSDALETRGEELSSAHLKDLLATANSEGISSHNLKDLSI